MTRNELEPAKGEKRLIVDLAACFYPKVFLVFANGRSCPGTDDSVDRARIKAFRLERSLDLPDDFPTEIGHRVHVQISDIRRLFDLGRCRQGRRSEQRRCRDAGNDELFHETLPRKASCKFPNVKFQPLTARSLEAYFSSLTTVSVIGWEYTGGLCGM